MKKPIIRTLEKFNEDAISNNYQDSLFSIIRSKLSDVSPEFDTIYYVSTIDAILNIRYPSTLAVYINKLDKDLRMLSMDNTSCTSCAFRDIYQVNNESVSKACDSVDCYNGRFFFREDEMTSSFKSKLKLLLDPDNVTNARLKVLENLFSEIDEYIVTDSYSDTRLKILSETKLSLSEISLVICDKDLCPYSCTDMMNFRLKDANCLLFRLFESKLRNE